MRVSPAPPPTVASNSTPQQPPHMAPAVGGPGGVVMPPHPGSGPGDSRNSNMHAPNYPGAPPHMPGGGPPPPHGFPSKMSHMPPGSTYNQPNYQGHQYPPRPPGVMQPYQQNYSQNSPQGQPPTSMPPGHQYPPRPPHNNHAPNQPYGYFGQNWGQGQGPPGPGMPGSPGIISGPGIIGKGQSNLPPGPNNGPRGHAPHPHYLKQHIQPSHKMYGTPGGPQMYPNGPGAGPVPNNRESPQGNMPPPTSTPQPMTPSSDLDHGATNNSTNSTNNSNNGSGSNPPTIGPDGNPIVDEASQQSTVSNNSASGDDRAITPKPLHKDGINLGLSSGGGLVGGPPNQHYTALNSAQSPGSASMTSQQDELENMNSPGWPRSPSTAPPPSVPYANSHPPPPPEIYRPSKGGDSISRLYEMSDNPERRLWLDKLLSFMDDNKTPITSCPTISKNPLDLYALYLHVKERGGFLEVTKNKQWKDVAAVMGIGASSSGSYTLRKHYMKHIIYFECKYDRGGIDPMPIIKQVETSTKKKSNKNISVPSPGSSNSQDSFPPSNSNSMDGFSNGPHMGGMPPYPQYPPSSEYPGHMQQRSSSQSGPGYQGYSGNQYPSGYQGMHGFNQGGYPPNSGYPPERGYQPSGPPNHQSNYQGYQPGNYQRPGYPPPPNQNYPPQEQFSGFQGGNMYPPNQKPGPSPSPGPPQSSPGPPLGPPSGPGGPYQGPRRHPDFEKNPPPPGWRGNSQFPGYSSSGPTPSSTTTTPAPTPNWNQPRFPSSQPGPFPNQNRWPGSFNGSGSRPPGPPSNKNFIVPPPTSFKSSGYGSYMGKQLFPVDSVEAVLPVLARRKRMAKSDITPVDPWKLFMSLRCGLAAEVTWALDVLNILLFDDHTVVYFGLQHLPGLLEALIEHLRRGLINMFDICSELELTNRDNHNNGANIIDKVDQNRQWYERPPPSPSLELDLGYMEDDQDPTNKEVIITTGADFTLVSKNGKPVKIAKKEMEPFVREGTRDWDKADLTMEDWCSGGGESTTHIVCSMQSSVLPLPFTRVLKDKNGEIKIETIVNDKSNSLNNKQKLDQVKHKEVVKTELMEVDNDDKKEKSKEKREDSKEKSEVNEKEKSEKSKKEKVEDSKKGNNEDSKKENREESKKGNSEESKKEKNEEICPKINTVIKLDDTINALENQKKDTVDKCNGPKDIQLNKCNSNSQKSRGGFFNSKSGTGKLDQILKRIKKEPVDNAINNKETDKNVESVNMDSKKLLDMVFKEEPSTEKPPDQVKIKEEPKVEEEKPINEPPTLIPVVSLKKTVEDATAKKKSTKRPYDDLEEESWSPDEASLSTTTEGQDWLARRVMCVGTVIRNLSFIPGNDEVMGRSAPLLALLGKMVLLHHDHPARYPSTAHYDRDEEGDLGDWCSSLAPDSQWWWPYLYHIHENSLVTLANMCTSLDLSNYPEEIALPILDGLLHWATCPASYGQDPLPGCNSNSTNASLSPQKLALEALVKLCVLDQNTDLVLATPPFARLDALCAQLTRMLCRGEDQVLREFAVNLLHYFSQADTGVARVIAMQNGSVSLLVSFIEEAEAAAMNIAHVQGINALKENPELMGTSLDMVRRSANTLVYLSKVPDNSSSLGSYENRLLTLVMSQILDTYVASQLSQVLFNVAQAQSDKPSPKERDIPFSYNGYKSSSKVRTEEGEHRPSINHTDSMCNSTDSPKSSNQVSPVSKDLMMDTENGYVSSTTSTSEVNSTTIAHSPLPASELTTMNMPVSNPPVVTHSL